jgi:hypothetical protein
MTGDKYCGYNCGEELEKIRDYCKNPNKGLEKIRDYYTHLNNFAKVNKEYAVVMYGKAMEIIWEEQQKLIKEQSGLEKIRDYGKAMEVLWEEIRNMSGRTN